MGTFTPHRFKGECRYMNYPPRHKVPDDIAPLFEYIEGLMGRRLNTREAEMILLLAKR